jgi:hypothetical protein
MMPELYGLPAGLSSISEKQPQMWLSRQAWRNAETSGPSSEHMICGLVSIDRPCSAYSGKMTSSIAGTPRLALPTMATIVCVCRARSAGVATTGNCS